ncbi:hypothetical protein AKJ16_DCAP11845 [Drosera capensis]
MYSLVCERAFGRKRYGGTAELAVSSGCELYHLLYLVCRHEKKITFILQAVAVVPYILVSTFYWSSRKKIKIDSHRCSMATTTMPRIHLGLSHILDERQISAPSVRTIPSRQALLSTKIQNTLFQKIKGRSLPVHRHEAPHQPLAITMIRANPEISAIAINRESDLEIAAHSPTSQATDHISNLRL